QVETDVSDLRANIELLVGEVSSSMTDTLADTSHFSATIDKSFRSLEQVQDESMSLSEVMDVVNQFVAESKDIRHSTKFLNRQLETASREIERLKSELASVQKNVLFDSLTNLYNRRSFD
ncbi:diguanylate cyclase, partial [Vibrio xuii]